MFKSHQHVLQMKFKECMETLVTRPNTEEFKRQIYCKKSLISVSMHYFDKYLDHMLVKFEQNRMVGLTQIFKLFGTKCLTIFDKALTPFWTDTVF